MKTLPFALVLLLGAGTGAAADAPWFDFENCGMCKHLSATEGMLMELGWEHHKTANGFMSVTTVPEKYETAYTEAMQNMHASGQKLMAGEQMPLCGMCQSLSSVLSTGRANMETFHTIGGEVMLVSSADAELVAKLHAHVDRTQEEMEKMMTAGESR